MYKVHALHVIYIYGLHLICCSLASSFYLTGGCRNSGSGVNLCDRRLTYRPWTCLLGDKESIASTISNAPKQFHFVSTLPNSNTQCIVHTNIIN